jgi:dipeptidase E
MKIIAIGGGEIGRPGTKVETTKIDKEIIKLTGKKKPNILFIPTASGDSEGYCEVVKKHFGKRLGCKVDNLLLIKEKLSKKEIMKKMSWADAVYVGGGNTKKMLAIWKKKGVDMVLRKEGEKGLVLSGLSAGAICWFSYGVSDSLKMVDKNAPYIKLKALGFEKGLISPHMTREPARRKDYKRMLKTVSFGYAISDCCALKIIDGKVSSISSRKNAVAFRNYWKGNKYYSEII